MKLSSPYIFHKIYNNVKIFKEPEKEIKIGYININGLYDNKSHTFLNNDKNLLLLDFLVVADTRLNEKQKTCDTENEFTNWKVIERIDSKDGRNHMGLLMLQSSRSFQKNIASNLCQKQYYKDEEGHKVIQIQVLSTYFLNYHLSAAFVYIRKTPSEAETRKLEECLCQYDLNLDAYRTADQQKLEILCQRKSKVLNEITTIRFNQLDHILLDCALFPEYFATSYRNHTTDHHAVVVRIANIGNKKSEAFLQNIRFDQENWTKLPKRKTDDEESLNEATRKEKHARIQTQKRKHTLTTKEDVQQKQRKVDTNTSYVHRTFRNPDAESCWINSCLQMVLTAMDNTDGLKKNGSKLWNEFINLIKKGKSSSLNPLNIRDIIIQTEKKRIRRENIVPLNRLFDLENMQLFEDRNKFINCSQKRRFGQQDCKDFFICLSENREEWDDVFKLFVVECESYTTCPNCSYVSRPANSTTINSFIMFECPNENAIMSSYIEEKMNQFEIRENWRDEDGCGEITMGRNSFRIKDINKIKNIIFIIRRLIQFEGNLEIVKRKVALGGDIILKDVLGNSATFTPLAVIHHSGEVVNNSTQGHYQADVVDVESGQWIQTSDNEAPLRINEASDQGYVYMYKKIQ